jgi:hypothetical protein
LKMLITTLPWCAVAAVDAPAPTVASMLVPALRRLVMLAALDDDVEDTMSMPSSSRPPSTEVGRSEGRTMFMAARWVSDGEGGYGEGLAAPGLGDSPEAGWASMCTGSEKLGRKRGGGLELGVPWCSAPDDERLMGDALRWKAPRAASMLWL